MNHRDRLWTALNHREPDRIPIDFGSTGITSISRQAYGDLRRSLGMPAGKAQLTDYIQQLALVDEDVLTDFAVDTRMVQPLPEGLPALVDEGDAWSFRDHWGAGLRMPKDPGLYYDWVDFPIKASTMAALEQYAWPSLDSDAVIDAVGRRAKRLYEHTDYALVASVIFGGGILEQPARLMGMESFYIALAKEPRFAAQLIERLTDLYIALCTKYLERIGQYIQVFAYWNDLAGQSGPLISPQLYRQIVKPQERRLVDAIKAKTNAKLFIHSCGAIRQFIPDFIDIGFDIVNPVQTSAAGMDLAALKRDFGRDIVFWGGTCDPQTTLPFGTPAQVKAETRRAIEVLAPGGGFVFSAIHNIQSRVPAENIFALFETVQEYGAY